MEINKEIFIHTLDKVMPAIVKDESSPLSCFFFKDNTVYGYNMEILISKEFPFDFIEDEFAINAKKLYSLLKKIPDKMIEIEISKTDYSLQIKTKNITANIKIEQKEDSFKTARDILKWESAPASLYTGFEMCYLPDNQYCYAGICTNKNKMISINGRMCNIFYMDKEAPDFWIDDNAIKAILKTFSNGKIIEISDTGTWIHFKWCDLIFSCRKIADKEFLFEEFEGLFLSYEKKEDDFEGCFVDEFNNVLNRASLFSAADNLVSIEFSPDKIKCNSANKTNRFTETIKCENKINAKLVTPYQFLQYALKRTSNFYWKEKRNDGEEKGNHIIFYADNYKLIIKSLE